MRYKTRNVSLSSIYFIRQNRSLFFLLIFFSVIEDIALIEIMK